MEIQRNTHPEDIKAAIRKTGTTLVSLSRELGYSDPAVGMALSRRWHEVRVGISKHLGRPLYDLWPEDYFADDRPRAHRPRQKATDSASGRRRQNAGKDLAA